LFGRSFAQPRLTAWHGEPHAVYSYSGLRLTPAPWTGALLEIRERIAAHTGWTLDGVLLNLYRDGRDSMGWHADDEPELGPEPRIASASLGETRRFAMRRRGGGKPRLALDLDHGSLLLMSGPTQAHWQHAVPKTTQQVGVRVNLTFRAMPGAGR
jgi:alkylated DNA repair dioxygenase AlkB